MPRKKAVKDSDLCAQGLTDNTERKIMATAMKQGEDQIDIIRQAKSDEQQESQEGDQDES